MVEPDVKLKTVNGIVVPKDIDKTKMFGVDIPFTPGSETTVQLKDI